MGKVSNVPRVEVLPIALAATTDPHNVNKHTQRGSGLLSNSLRKRGAFRSIASAGKGVKTPVVMAGNLTLETAADVGFTEVVNVHVTGNQLVNVVRDDLEPNSAAAIALGLEDNEIGKQSYNPDIDILAAVMADPAMQALREEDKMLADLVAGIAGQQTNEASTPQEVRQTLTKRFGVPPFSVLDARQGYWQDRKRVWIGLGLKGELGRGDSLLKLSDQTDEYRYNKKEYPSQSKQTLGAIASNAAGENGRQTRTGKYSVAPKVPGTIGGRGASLGQGLTAKRGTDGKLEYGNILAGRAKAFGTEGNISEATGTSIFDPVLSELLYRWFMPQGGHVLNPMSGEATHGVVAGYLGYKFTGVELRPEQAESNREQARSIGVDRTAQWITADALTIDTLNIEPADFVVSCPPYADLEVYSDNPLDISTMEYKEFIAVYSEIIRKSCAVLREDRFAAFVVGEVRDKAGIYYDFVGDTIKAFKAAGLKYYNEMILVTSVGSLPIRAGRQFDAGRKIGKTHQNVLVFLKGDSKKAVKACGPITVEIPDAVSEDD